MGILETSRDTLSASVLSSLEATDRVLGEHVDLDDSRDGRSMDENGVESVLSTTNNNEESDGNSNRSNSQQNSHSNNSGSGNGDDGAKQPGANVAGAKVATDSSAARKNSGSVNESRARKTMGIHQNDENNILRRNNFNNHHRATGMSVRCHCNLASCASNNYMCKSERRVTEDGKELEAGCFVEELEGESNSGSQHGAGVAEWNGRVATARRGCIEMLSREKQDMCTDRTGAPVHCCTQDMCNYPKTFYPANNFQTTSHSRLPYDSTGGIRGMSPQNLDHQVWLRAAVIAVPICGLMILVVLIIVARRLLKSDDDYKDPDSIRNRRKSMCGSASGMRHPNFNLNYSSHVPMGGGQHMHVKPVYIEPNEYLLPETHCCCHNNSSEPSVVGTFAFRKNSNSASETEELVNSSSNNVPHHCHCPSSDSESHSGSYCSVGGGGGGGGGGVGRPPSEAATNSGVENLTPKKFNLLAKLGLSRTGATTDNNHSNHTNRPFHV